MLNLKISYIQDCSENYIEIENLMECEDSYAANVYLDEEEISVWIKQLKAARKELRNVNYSRTLK